MGIIEKIANTLSPDHHKAHTDDTITTTKTQTSSTTGSGFGQTGSGQSATGLGDSIEHRGESPQTHGFSSHTGSNQLSTGHHHTRDGSDKIMEGYNAGYNNVEEQDTMRRGSPHEEVHMREGNLNPERLHPLSKGGNNLEHHLQQVTGIAPGQQQVHHTTVREAPVIRDHHHSHVREEINPVQYHQINTKEVRPVYENVIETKEYEPQHHVGGAAVVDHKIHHRENKDVERNFVDDAKREVQTEATHDHTHHVKVNPTEHITTQGRHEIEEHIVPVVDRHHHKHEKFSATPVQVHEHEAAPTTNLGTAASAE